MRLFNAAVTTMLVFALSVAMPGTASAASQVPDAVRSKLDHGINLSFWFTDRDNPKLDPQVWRPDDSDLAQLKRAGFRNARVPFDRAWIADPKNPSQVAVARAQEYADGLQRVAGQGFLVVATLTSTTPDLTRMLTDENWAQTVAALWWSLAKQLSAKLGPNQLVFEVLNEPGNEDAAASAKLMQMLAGSVRDAAPKHTIAVAGHKYSSVDELIVVKPFLDPNLVYSFHFYEPMNFTHQGAYWGWSMWGKLHGLPYPSTEKLVTPLLAGFDAESMPHARYYGQQEWNRDKLAAILDKVAAWQKQTGAVAWCSEFGALKTQTPPASRAAWLRDTRELLEARHIPWTHFDFSQHMGVVDGPQGARVWDRSALQALGLKTPE